MIPAPCSLVNQWRWSVVIRSPGSSFPSVVIPCTSPGEADACAARVRERLAGKGSSDRVEVVTMPSNYADVPEAYVRLALR